MVTLHPHQIDELLAEWTDAFNSLIKFYCYRILAQGVHGSRSEEQKERIHRLVVLLEDSQKDLMLRYIPIIDMAHTDSLKETPDEC